MRKRTAVICLFALLAGGLSACGAGNTVSSGSGGETGSDALSSAEGRQVRMTSGDTEVVITLNDSRAAADFAGMLPLELTLIERSGFAKGMTLPRALATEEPTTREYTVGDFGYWAAGPDLAIFYDDIYELTMVPVIPLGRAETGAENMRDTSGTVRLELVPEGQEEGASSQAPSDGENSSGSSAAGVPLSGDSILIAYFSVPETDGVDTVAGTSRVAADGEVLGNNQYVAQLIQQETGGDLFRIETVQEYPGSHDPLLEFAYNERAEDGLAISRNSVTEAEASVREWMDGLRL